MVCYLLKRTLHLNLTVFVLCVCMWVLGWMRQEVNGGGKVGEEEVKDVRVNGGRLKRREHAGGVQGRYLRDEDKQYL